MHQMYVQSASIQQFKMEYPRHRERQWCELPSVPFTIPVLAAITFCCCCPTNFSAVETVIASLNVNNNAELLLLVFALLCFSFLYAMRRFLSYHCVLYPSTSWCHQRTSWQECGRINHSIFSFVFLISPFPYWYACYLSNSRTFHWIVSVFMFWTCISNSHTTYTRIPFCTGLLPVGISMNTWIQSTSSRHRSQECAL